jgi:hypothetical protein
LEKKRFLSFACRLAARCAAWRSKTLLCLLYHEAKMLACKGIFAKPSTAQPCDGMVGEAERLGGARLCCAYYAMKLWKIRWFCKAK